METEVQCEDPPPPDGAFFGVYVREDIPYSMPDPGELPEIAQVEELVHLNPYEDMEAESGLVWGGSTYLTAEEETMDPESMPRAVKRNALRGLDADQDDDEPSAPLYDWQIRFIPIVSEGPEEGSSYWEKKGFFETAMPEACQQAA